MKRRLLLSWLLAVVPLFYGHQEDLTTTNDDHTTKLHSSLTEVARNKRSSGGHYDMARNTMNNQRRMLPAFGNNQNFGTNGYPGNINNEKHDKVVGGTAADALKTFYNIIDGKNVNFGYRIDDPVTSNRQARYEKGNPKDEVTGSYSIQEADGTMRIVYYVADWINGFRATVTDKDGMRRYGGISNNDEKDW